MPEWEIMLVVLAFTFTVAWLAYKLEGMDW